MNSYNICTHCMGLGYVSYRPWPERPPRVKPCEKCGGTGSVPWRPLKK